MAAFSGKGEQMLKQVTTSGCRVRPGEIVVARLFSDRHRGEKARPAIVIGRWGNRVAVVPLTTKRFDRDGNRLRSIRAAGLHHGSYVWPWVTLASHNQIDKHVGWIDTAAADAVLDTVRLDAEQRRDLINGVLERR